MSLIILDTLFNIYYVSDVKHSDSLLRKINHREVSGRREGRESGIWLALDSPVSLSCVYLGVELISSEGELLVKDVCQVVLGSWGVPVSFSK